MLVSRELLEEACNQLQSACDNAPSDLRDAEAVLVQLREALARPNQECLQDRVKRFLRP